MNKPMMDEPSDEQAQDTVKVPVAMLGGAKAGQTVTLSVDSIDDASGMATLSAGETPKEEGSDKGAIDSASDLFNEGA